MKESMRSNNLNLFENDNQIEAEKTIIEISNDVYTSLDLKPMSKTVFFISRALLVMSRFKVKNYEDLLIGYEKVFLELKNKNKDLSDDFNFDKIVNQNKNKLDNIINKLNYIYSLNIKSDITGLVFNSLLRGKFEAGEGLGTFLTPEEVVSPVNEMLLNLYFRNNKKLKGYIGDISGGTGSFLNSIKNKLVNYQVFNKKFVNSNFYLFDISNMSVSLAKINFYIEKMYPNFFVTDDSLIDKNLKKLNNKFSILATNPPFGSGKYKFNENIKDIIDKKYLEKINFVKEDQKIDPAELFLLRNIQLLTTDGVLGIVLPDGICKTNRIDKVINLFNDEKFYINIVALISLPSHTFSLGGTVAKSSFVIIEKSLKKRTSVFREQAENIGYLKKGNFKVIDDKGNDLNDIVIKFNNFLKYDYSTIESVKKHHVKNPLKKYLFVPQNFLERKKNQKKLHISILDVDNTGLIDIVQSIKNETVTKPKLCDPNDILISCINPRKWRVVLVPEINFNFTCSPEFIVLRAKNPKEVKSICLSLFSEHFKEKFINLGKGTSSSRQRVPKDIILDISLPPIKTSAKEALKFFERRKKYYLDRIEELNFLSRY